MRNYESAKEVLNNNQSISERIDLLTKHLSKLIDEEDGKERERLMIDVSKELCEISKLNLESTLIVSEWIIK